MVFFHCQTASNLRETMCLYKLLLHLFQYHDILFRKRYSDLSFVAETAEGLVPVVAEQAAVVARVELAVAERAAEAARVVLAVAEQAAEDARVVLAVAEQAVEPARVVLAAAEQAAEAARVVLAAVEVPFDYLLLHLQH